MSMLKKQLANARFAIVVGTIPAFMIVAILFGLVWPMLQVQAGPTPPPRGTPPVTPQPRHSEDDDDDDTVIGAYIELFVPRDPTSLWTVVQWQDSRGNWHNIDGWQGHLETGGYKRWWVAEKDFNTGPFRWIVTQGTGGTVLGASEPFSLPAGANEVVQVTVSLP
jgi:hypothetical protein